ncbi:DUF7919 family protein [Streptomyces bohaiensis]|uniref:DUF7919 domain-containing protein n=1 Tax=Streptomyces bohaiensis TaxID=1431344 RepID=A0ABX1CA89_9ACTN|nr:hypothetical protein [Streptomyces bohaiensis]NJQ16050.1 hypothetical protein [Streptomyces bohaiensis]
MTHYEDLTPYEYDDEPLPGGVNIGWLSKQHPYRHGRTPEGLVEALAHLAKDSKNRYRGYHHCELCSSFEEAEQSARREGLFMGNAEIHIPGGSGITYVAPTLIVHYVEAHEYLPPDAFIDSTLRFSQRVDLRESG